MADEFAGVAALLAVASRGSFTAAAADLGVTPSAVSQTVRSLEDRLHVRLVERTTRSVRLTEAGTQFVARAKPAVDEMRGALSSMAELGKGPSGTLRLTVARTAYDELEPMFAAFLHAYGDVALEVSLDDSLVDIVESGFDAGVRLGESVERGMIGVQLTEACSAVVGSPSYFAKHPKPKHPRDLLGHDCVCMRLPTAKALYRWEFTEDGRDFQLAVRGRITVNDGTALRLAAERGLGLAYVLESTARAQVQAGTLVRVLEAYCPPYPGFFLYYPSRANMALKLRALVDFARKWRRDRRPRGRSR
jgi:DNA-binding transcriptional LysR family regulator